MLCHNKKNKILCNKFNQRSEKVKLSKLQNTAERKELNK
jgi:hypothetical protein